MSTLEDRDVDDYDVDEEDAPTFSERLEECAKDLETSTANLAVFRSLTRGSPDAVELFIEQDRTFNHCRNHAIGTVLAKSLDSEVCGWLVELRDAARRSNADSYTLHHYFDGSSLHYPIMVTQGYCAFLTRVAWLGTPLEFISALLPRLSNQSALAESSSGKTIRDSRFRRWVATNSDQRGGGRFWEGQAVCDRLAGGASNRALAQARDCYIGAWRWERAWIRWMDVGAHSWIGSTPFLSDASASR